MSSTRKERKGASRKYENENENENVSEEGKFL